MWWLFAGAVIAALIGLGWQPVRDKWAERGKFLIACSATAIGVALALWVDHVEVVRRERAALQAVLTDLFIGAQSLGALIEGTKGATERSGANCVWIEPLRVKRELLTRGDWDGAEAAKYTSGQLRQALRMGFLEVEELGRSIEQRCIDEKTYLPLDLSVYQAFVAKLTFTLGLTVAILESGWSLKERKLFRCLLPMNRKYFADTTVQTIVFESECCEEYLRAKAEVEEKWVGTSEPAFFSEMNLPPPARVLAMISDCPRPVQASTPGEDD